MLFLNNDEVASVVDMKATMEVVEEGYRQLFRGEATCTPRCNTEIPTREAGQTFAFGVTTGGSSVTSYLAMRVQSDISYTQERDGFRTREKFAGQVGSWCGFYMLFDVQSAVPLAIINDGYLQHMRQGADGGIGAKYMAREDSEVLGMLGSGGMARTRALSIAQARNIKKMKVFSPTRANREAFAREMAEKLGIEVIAVDNAQEAHEDVDILATCADATQPVVIGKWLREGTHIVYAAGALDHDAAAKVDVSLRLGNTPTPKGKDWHERSDTVIWEARPKNAPEDPSSFFTGDRAGAGAIDRTGEILWEDLLAGSVKGRTGVSQITHSDRGGMRGVEHAAIAAKAYELAKAKGLGREVPTEWMLENIRD